MDGLHSSLHFALCASHTRIALDFLMGADSRQHYRVVLPLHRQRSFRPVQQRRRPAKAEGLCRRGHTAAPLSQRRGLG